jgi:hypothetical protein
MANPPRARDPGSAVPPGIPGPGSEMIPDHSGKDHRDRDPGDAVPSGVARPPGTSGMSAGTTNDANPGGGTTEK